MTTLLLNIPMAKGVAGIARLDAGVIFFRGLVEGH